jgi:hypothetical protein
MRFLQCTKSQWLRKWQKICRFLKQQSNMHGHVGRLPPCTQIGIYNRVLRGNNSQWMKAGLEDTFRMYTNKTKKGSTYSMRIWSFHSIYELSSFRLSDHAYYRTEPKEAFPVGNNRRSSSTFYYDYFTIIQVCSASHADNAIKGQYRISLRNQKSLSLMPRYFSAL